jgi:outer membrane receptor protein involved in Fe transport
MGVCYTMRNLGKVESYGGELSARWLPTGNDNIDFSVAHLNAYVAESQKVLVNASGLMSEAKGATMPDSPKWQINASWEHMFHVGPGSLILRGDGRYQSKSYIGDFSYLAPGTTTINFPRGHFSRTYLTRDIYTSEAHTVYDFTSTFLMRDGDLRFTAYVKNITEVYWKVFTDGTKTTITDPRTYGVTFSVRF